MKQWIFYIVLVCSFFMAGCEKMDPEEKEGEEETKWETEVSGKYEETEDPGPEERNPGKQDSVKKDSGKKDSEKRNVEEKAPGKQEDVPTHQTVDYEQISGKKYSWWMKRNEEHKRPETQGEVDLSEYDARYVGEDPEEKVIYLTFDCGYENGYTPAILDILKKHRAPAVFFVTGHFAKTEGELLKRMKQEGHYIGNHTSHHPDLTALDTRQVKLELKECEEAVWESSGQKMDPFFRPPRGEYSERVLQIVKDMGYHTLFWSMAYVDYDVNDQPGKEYVREHYRKYIHPGAIPLIHNVSSSNAEALDEVLTGLKAAGYRFGDPMEQIRGKKEKKK